MSTKLLACVLLAGCAVDELSTVTSALTDPDQLPDVPGQPTPPGYGHYCSITDPTNGGWMFGGINSTRSNPCGDMASQVGPSAVVQRAGLYALEGNNQVMVRCDGGMVTGRIWGAAVISWITSQIDRKDRNCMFTIAPTKLPVWGPPFYEKPSGGNAFDYDYLDHAWDVTEFGGPPTGVACSMGRTAVASGLIDGFGNCVNFKPAGLHWAREPAYDWSLPRDTPLRAVADGVVRASYARNTAPMCGSNQNEVFIETQVGKGQYAEHFIAGYYHLNDKPDVTKLEIAMNVIAWGGPMAPVGTVVKKGDVIGYVGDTGKPKCASGPHLHFGVFKLTNLTDARAYEFEAIDTQYDANGNAVLGATGVNGWHGVIDPFGWAGPQNVDPMAFKFIGSQTADQPSAIKDAGAFSIKLWDKLSLGGKEIIMDLLPHDGGDSW